MPKKFADGGHQSGLDVHSPRPIEFARELVGQVKKQEIRGMLTDVDKEGAASVSFNDFVEMVTPKVLARDPKVSFVP